MTNPTPETDTFGQSLPPPEKKGGDESGGGPFAGIIQWLGDSYNGLYKIVLEPSMPRRYQVYLIIFGAILGMIWAWGVFQTQFTGANPNRLNQSAQDQWVKMVAVASSTDPLISYQPLQAQDLLSRVPNPVQTIERLLNDSTLSQSDRSALEGLLATIPPDMTSAVVPPETGLLTSILQILLLILLIGIITPIWMLLWRILIYPNIVAGLMDQFKKMTNKEYAEQRKREEESRKAAQLAAEAKRNMVVESDATLGEPVMKTLSIFSTAREYDDSFEIELPLAQGGDFLGQCGATIAEAVSPDPIAIEMWLFDMFTQQDKKSVFITEAGYNDPAIRARVESSLENPANLRVARNGEKLIVDSDKLRLQGEMKELAIDANGRFASFQMPIAAWRKDGAAPAAMPPAPAGNLYAPPPPAPSGLPDMSSYDNLQYDPPPQPPVGGRSMSDYDDIQYDPPPAMPGQNPLQPPPLQSPPPSQGMQPLQPPPLRRNPPEDDPFGGTGDFTPLND